MVDIFGRKKKETERERQELYNFFNSEISKLSSYDMSLLRLENKMSKLGNDKILRKLAEIEASLRSSKNDIGGSWDSMSVDRIDKVCTNLEYVIKSLKDFLDTGLGKSLEDADRFILTNMIEGIDSTKKTLISNKDKIKSVK